MKKDSPVALVVNLPIRREAKSKKPAFLPTIFLRDEGIYKDAFRYVEAYSLSYELSSLRTRVDTIARFLNFWNLFMEIGDVSIDEQTNSIFSYIDVRIEGTVNLEETHPLWELNWEPIQKEHARNEFRYITDFFGYLETSRDLGDGVKFVNKAKLTFANKKQNRHGNFAKLDNRSFFAHLKKSREFWREIRGESYRLPTWQRPVSTQASARLYPELEEIAELILSEKNPGFRAIWVALAFGSHRVSEVLHAWQCDVLPARNRAKFFGPANAKNSQVAFIMAHPSESTYTDDPSARGLTREKYLKRKYGLVARNLLPKGNKNRIGWKSKEVFGSAKISDTFWLHPEAATLFEECVQEIQKFHLANRTSRMHPYLFVNMQGRGDSFAQPMKYSRVVDALNSAYRRIGITTDKNGRNLHGFRHFAKNYAEVVLGLSNREIQVIRGDKSINSQDDYGKNVARFHEAMRHAKHIPFI